MADESQGQGESHGISFQPVPASFKFEPARVNDQPIVVLTIQTMDNVSVTFWPPESINLMVELAQKAAVYAKTGLIIPGGNGAGVTDLSAFRDQGADEVMDVGDVEE